MKWRMKNGELISIKKMDNKHLYNTIKMIERSIDRQVMSIPEPEGDMALLHFNDGVDVMFNIIMPKIYYKMIKEAKKRNIIDNEYYVY